MCGRYSCLTEDEIIEVRSIIQKIALDLVRDEIGTFYTGVAEVRPTDIAPVIIREPDGIAFENAKFGFKKWDGKGVIINARSEGLQTTRMFSKLLTIGRCVVPASEFFEWKEQADGGNTKRKTKKKQKHFVKDKEGNILFFAGLYRDGEDGREFVIITKDATGDVADIHDRMPVVLRVDQLELWLNGTLTADDISKMDFSAYVAPCEDEQGVGDDVEGRQMTLFD